MDIFLAKAFLVVAVIAGYMLGWSAIWPWIRGAAIVVAPLLIILAVKHGGVWLLRRRRG